MNEQHNIKIEVINSTAGSCICINDTRVCGVKPWGAGIVVNSFIVSLDNIIDAIGKDRLMKVEVVE